MPTRNPYMSGSPYPTGMAPVALDLEKSIGAITQQLVENRRNEIKEKKLAISKDEENILNSLDFKTLEGAGDKFLEQQSQRISDMTDKWAGRWKERQGILSTQDKLELKKDKRDIEAKLAMGTADLAQIKAIQDELKKLDNSIYDVPKTSERLNKYIKDGLAGTGGAINIPVLKPQQFGSAFISMIDPFMKRRSEDFIELAEVKNPSTGEISMSKSNAKSVDEGIEFLKTTPEYQELYKENPVEAERMMKFIQLKYSSDAVKEGFNAAVKPRVGGRSSATKPNETASANRFSEVSHGLMNHQQWAIDAMTSPEFGEVDKIRYEYDDNGKEIMLVDFKPTPGLGGGQTQKETMEIPMPQTPEEEMSFAEDIWKIYPEKSKSGMKTFSVPKDYSPKSSVEQQKVEKSIPVEYGRINSVLYDLDNEMTKDNIKKLVEVLSNLKNPKIKIEFRNPLRWQGVNLNGVDYNLTNPDTKMKNYEDFKADIKLLTNITWDVYQDPDGRKYNVPSYATDKFLIKHDKAVKL